MPVLDRAKSQATPRSPQPNPPVRQFSFTDFQTNNPSAPLPADRIDGEIDRTNNALSDTLDWVSVSLNSDGSLKPQSVGKAQLQPGLFDQIAAPALDEIQGLANSARAAAREASAASQEADASAFAAAAQNALALDASARSSSDAQDAASSAAEAAASANAAAASANNSSNSANYADLAEATCIDYGVLTQAWAEHMPDTIPPNILAVMDVTGDHWSSRWWANQAALIIAQGTQAITYIGDTPPPAVPPVKAGAMWWDSIGGQLYVFYDDPSADAGQWVAAVNRVGPAGPIGPAGPTGNTGAQGPPGTGSVAGMTIGQIPIAASATGIAASANLSGDVVSTPTTLATTIQPNAVTTAKILNAAVTYAKIQNVAANRILGNSTGTPAAPAEIPLPLAVALGGTNASTAPSALTSLGAAPIASPSFTGGVTATGNLTVTGLITSQGGSAGQVFEDRAAPGTQWNWYATGGSARLWQTSDRFTVTAAGNAGQTGPLFTVANATTPRILLDNTTAAQRCGIANGSGSFYVGNFDASGNFTSEYAHFTLTQSFNSSAVWTAFSDPRLKQDVAPYTRGLDAVLALNPVTFRYRPDTPFAKGAEPSDPLLGLLADEVKPYVPEIVGDAVIRLAAGDVSVSTLEPGNLIYALINAVKELSAKVAALEAA
jgi:hypothetical protein